ncbi:hypothetical protein [Sphingobium chlorophenolicum]|uniref:Glycerophosphoryl diester phosphodiesterase membrane domain-containing protein n=1 Tax=Sphingobium chlorophenolicum TaxID=46429 RepID=A0A081R8V9_SPHCR|nr:hypothetical protein [Sphingobium chlorophenolicum]KEQ51632.1 hypothetical protein BV95_04101 [Sphingobium chlorophenolicum]
MATQAGWTEERSFSIGTVLSRTFGTLGGNPVATFGITFLFSSLPQLLYSYFIGSTLAMADRSSTVAVIAVSLGSYAVFLMLSMLAQGGLVRAAIAHAEGERASLAQCIGTGLSVAVPLIGLSILMILGVLVGSMLLIVPGVILYLMWSVAVPALVAEEQGVFAAFSRSRALTKGVRWRIFGLQVLMVVLIFLFSAVVGAVVMAGGMASVQGLARPGPLTLIFSGVSNTLFIAFWSTAQANLYLGLRAWKDGPQAGRLAEIFA